MQKQAFTLNNLKKFWDDYRLNIPDEDDTESYLEFLYLCEEAISNYFDIPEYLDVNLILDALILNDFSSIDYAFDTEEQPIELNIFKVFNYSDSDKIWKKTPEILNNLNSIIAYIQSMSEDEALILKNILEKTGNNYPLNSSGSICSPRKYVANSGRKLPKRVIPVELRINTKAKANYRVYGILINTVFYLLECYTKNSGQDRADSMFDAFIDKANKFIKDKKLLESKIIVEEELMDLYNEDFLADICKGRSDALNNIVDESNSSIGYVTGYNQVKQAEKENKFKEWYLNHRKNKNK